MKQRLRLRFWLELAVATVNIFLLLMTALWPDWIELVFRVEPDAGSGALELSIVVVTLVLSIAFLLLAGVEWRRTARQAA